MHDEDLHRARDGDKHAINSLLQKHRDLAFSIALKYIRNDADAEDIVQDAFIKVFLNIGKFRNEAAFSTWLFKIVYVETMRYINRQQKIRTIKEEAAADEAVEMEVFTADRSNSIQTAMQCLTSNEYMIMNLFYLLQKDMKEIEVITGQSKANIKVLLHRGRKRMAVYFSEHEALKDNL